MSSTLADDFTTVTEVPGLGASREQYAMLATRYAFAARYCEGRDVLELACGAAIGLGHLARGARRVVGGDRTATLLATARRSHGDRVPFVQLDAHALPFRDASYDVVVLYEAIYYLADAARALAECRRLLRPGGVLLVCSVNREWREFNPSPFSTRYFSARELRTLLTEGGFAADLYGGFPAPNAGTGHAVVGLLKRVAVAAGLMPRTMRGKQMLKRVFFGPLQPLPAVLPAAGDGAHPLVPLSADAAGIYKVIYAVARVPGGDRTW